MSYDVLIIGGGAAGMSCALVLGSAKNAPFRNRQKYCYYHAPKSFSFSQRNV